VLERAAGLVDRGRELAAAPSGDTVIGAAASRQHALALKNDGSLSARGDNEHRQLGLRDGALSSRPARVDAQFTVTQARGVRGQVGQFTADALPTTPNHGPPRLNTNAR